MSLLKKIHDDDDDYDDDEHHRRQQLARFQALVKTFLFARFTYNERIKRFISIDSLYKRGLYSLTLTVTLTTSRSSVDKVLSQVGH